MARNLRHFTSALVATCAIAVLVAPAALATNFTSTSGEYPVSYSGAQVGAQPNTLTADGYTVTCKSMEYEGELKEKSQSLTLTPIPTECTAFGLGAIITMGGCDFLLKLPAMGTLATMDLICPAGKEVTINAGGGLCVTHTGPRAGLEDVKVENVAGGTLKAIFTVAGLTTALTDVGGFFCPFSGNTTVEATYTGSVVIVGTKALHVL